MLREWASTSGLPSSLPAPRAWLYGWVDTSVPGHRVVREGATVRTVASGYYRGDALATAITATGPTATIDRGVWAIAPTSPPDTLTANDRLLVVLGLAGAVGQSLASAATHTASRICPFTIPLEGASWAAVRIDADDVMQLSRQQRASGYCWGAVRVWDVAVTMHRTAFEAFAAGWCTKGKVTIVCGDDTPMSSTNPDGYIEGQVLAVSEPEAYDATELLWRVRLRIAEVPA